MFTTEDGFEDMPKLIRYIPPKADNMLRNELKPIDVDTQELPNKPLDNILMKKPARSELPEERQMTRTGKFGDIDVKELAKLEKSLKIETAQSLKDANQQPSTAQQQMNKSKNLISQMVNKISAKNVAQQLLPISNETIHKLVKQIDQQKQQLVQKAMGYQLQLSSNPYNKNIQKELQVLEKGIDRYDTMKLLYLDKVEMRNENRRLLGVIEDLKRENKEIKAKIAQGIQQIEAHMHNLPCDKEKAMAIEIRKCQEELKSEREMRINLEKSISNTIQNFTRLYEEADLARKIVVGQLKEVEMEKQRLKMDEEGNSESRSVTVKTESQSPKTSRQKDNNRWKKPEKPNEPQRFERQERQDPSTVQKQRTTPQLPITKNMRQHPTSDNQRTYRKSQEPLENSNQARSNLEDLVEKMRSNQALLRQIRP